MTLVTTRHRFPLVGRLLRLASLCALVGLAALATPDARAPRAVERRAPGHGAPVQVEPLEGERVVDGGLRLAVGPLPGRETRILLSRRPFSAEGMDRLPERADIRIVPAPKPVLSAADLGLAEAAMPGAAEDDAGAEPHGAAGERTWYWAVAALDPTTGTARISPTRQFTLLPAWQVGAHRAPWVMAETRGHRDLAHDPAPAPPGATTPAAGAAGLPARGGARLHLAAGYEFDPLAQDMPQAALAARPLPVGDDDRPTLIVQFDHPPTDADRDALLAQGLVPVSYLPDDAFVVRGTTGLQPALNGLAGVRWVGDYAPAFRLSPRLNPTAAGNVTLVVLFFDDAELDAHLAALRDLGGTIAATSNNGINKLAHVTLPAARAEEVARLSGVAWVEPFVAPTLQNDNAQWVVQTNVNGNRRLWTQGIDGTGQVVHTSDSGITVGHDMFRDPLVPITGFGDFPTHRKIIAYKAGANDPAVVFGDHSGASYHGTHTAGTICGNDGPVSGTSLRDGMARGAKIFFQDLSGPSLANGITHFPDLNDLFIVPYLGNAGGAARISSNSWGSNTAGAYDVSCLQVDQFMWAHKDFLIFFSNGNAGTAGSVGSPAAAKNICSAGGTQNGTLATSIYASTSRGPTQDGRRKPTIASPGQSINSANGATTNGYKSLSGTSMASPSQAGAAALIRQYLAEGWYPTGTKIPADALVPSAALLKAMCVNSADNDMTGYVAPDNNVGWGRIDADNVCYFAGDARKLIAVDNSPGLGQGDYIEYTINVTSSALPLKVTLCWTDYPALPASATQLVNNLNLTVSNGATIYKGNVFASGSSVTGGSYDNLNVEEGVAVASPATGLWTVRVAGAAVPYGPQPYGLVVTGGVDDGAGTLYLDRAEYPANGSLLLKVIDTNAGPTVTVHVTSPTEPAGEDVVLTGGDGVFTGTLPLSPWLPVTPHAAGGLAPRAFDAPDDTLRVSHGDALVATYQDASPAATLTATATVALERPLITAVQGRSNGSGAAAVSWNTDVNADSRVYFGLTPALELGSRYDATARLSHDIALPATAGQTLYFDVESTGLNGNVTRDDNGGQHYRVTVDPPADILLVIGDSSFDRLQTWQDALNAAGWSYDVWSGALADNPQLGNRLSGLRSYKAVLWQAGFDQYPPISDTQRAVISQYVAGGGRLAVVGHDIAWALGDAASPSPYYTPLRAAWLAGTLHTTFNADPTTWSQETGVAADPISGPYTAGVPYTPIHSGGAGDEIDGVAGAGSFSYTWRNNEATPDDTGFRWLSGANNGSPDSAQWGGQPSRLVTMYFEWSALAPPYTAPNATRTDILDRTIVWLLGRDRPEGAINTPVGGATVTGDTLVVNWSETAGGGAGIARRTLELSLDGGASWTTVADSLPPPPCAWPIGATPNSPTARLRLRLVDDGNPALAGTVVMAQNFALQRATADGEGPLVVAGSLVATPNPFVQASPAQLAARVTDVARGGQAVVAAEWSRGAAAAPPGAGTPMAGPFGTVTVNPVASVATKSIPAGAATFWVRGRDALGNWGPAAALPVIVNTGAFAVARALCPTDSTLFPGDTLALALRVRNAGTAADSLRCAVSVVAADPGVALVGGPTTSTFWVAPGDTAALVGPSATATASAGPGATLALKLLTWPRSDSTDRDSCLVTLVVRRAVAAVDCPSDTTLQPGSTLPLGFVLRNTGNRADSLHWSLVDLGPGPLVALDGGSTAGVAWPGATAPAFLVLPGISVTADPGAPNGQTTRLRLVTWAGTDTAAADTCATLVTVSGTSGVTGGVGAGAPAFGLAPNQPNPFAGSTRIRFNLPAPERITVRLYALDGQLVRTLVEARLDPGRHEVTWDGADADGRSVPAGLYFYRLATESGRVATGRLLRVR